ncbi:MAG: type II secretion system F family protein [Clostridia bacterium]|nr:type II secretion system F family protein [Clostridia bacterium]
MAVFFNESGDQLILLKGSRVPVQTLALFCYQMGAMLDAGLPLLACLSLNRHQAPGSLQTALHKVEQDLKEGSTLARALDQHPQVFPVLMVSMVEAGELGGILPQVFSWLADHYERENKLREQTKSALAYPLLVLVLTLLSLVVMSNFVLPNFALILHNLGVPLPWVTQAVLKISNLMTHWGFLPVLVAIITSGILYLLFQRPEIRIWWDRIILAFPILGDLVVKVIAARFCRLLGALLGNGVPIIQAIMVVKETLGNRILQESLELAHSSLEEGKSLARPLAESKLFPLLLVQMVASGEESGRLPEFLQKLSIYYDQEIERTLDRITALLEPALVLLLGFFVGGMVIALLLPMFSLLNTL